VRNERGVVLGKVKEMLETGANDVLVVAGDRERLVPFTQGQVVLEVNLDQGLILVDWDEDF
jgi:16S rRNA processing protein RimM